MKHRNHAAPAAHHVAVARATEARVLRPGVGVGLHEHFFRAKFGGAIKIDRIYGFVGAQGQNSMHALVDGGIDHVAAAHDVGLDGFKRVVFARRHLLKRGRVDHDRHSGKGALQALRVAHVPNEVAEAGMIEAPHPHIVLLELVTAEDDELLGMVVTQHHLHELLPERPRPAGDQHNLIGPVHRCDSSSLETRIISAALGEYRSLTYRKYARRRWMFLHVKNQTARQTSVGHCLFHYCMGGAVLNALKTCFRAFRSISVLARMSILISLINSPHAYCPYESCSRQDESARLSQESRH